MLAQAGVTFGRVGLVADDDVVEDFNFQKLAGAVTDKTSCNPNSPAPASASCSKMRSWPRF
jgi:hypothetical protein